jgi:CRISPR-associated protein Csb2
MTLILEIEHLLGVAFAARGPADEAPDWPPQPDRVFSALVAAWGSRGEQPDERRALEWLEAQPAPDIAASAGFPRSAPTVFVPPNDPETGRIGNRSVMPALRRRQPRRFPAYRPDDPVVRLVWRGAVPDAAMLASLNALAAATPYVGHSASVTRCHFRQQDAVPEKTLTPHRGVYRGRLSELERSYRSGQRPAPGDEIQTEESGEKPAPHGIFSERWLILEHVSGDMPDLRAVALVTKALRKALMAGYERAGLGNVIPGVLSGHAADGTPLAEPHIAIVPLAFIGVTYADGGVLGFGVVPPHGIDLFGVPGLREALRQVAPRHQDRRELELAAEGFRVVLGMGGEATRRSLDPTPYLMPSRTWASATPIVLDRRLKKQDAAGRAAEMEALVRSACINIDLPEPERIVLGKHSALEGAPPAYPSHGAPAWMGWRLSQSLASRRLTHAVIRFKDPVRGPVLIGAGRFVGLGLCRSLDRAEPRG